MSEAITPYIGAEGQRRIRFWEKSENAPAFVRALASQADSGCRNCADYGVILISFCKYGPSSLPLSHKKASTYFPGNTRFGKGWYLIEQTLGISCPACKDRRSKQARRP